MNELMNIDVSQISFAVLFVWLLIDTNKKNQAREEKYQGTIDKLAENIGVIQEVKEDVEEIRDIIQKSTI